MSEFKKKKRGTLNVLLCFPICTVSHLFFFPLPHQDVANMQLPAQWS